ncbi:glycine betaine/proline transport system substrate-binding protein [Sanguibacter gelidistatuariae]|uniref:Glycine betaine/proline transport system substrate-binding protein n=1 Tax=Sanguibacter gelidistatuariae TaxID=1814289 RepID=A0A1G6VVQ5_9MICO|nr:glycine betaine ABC transporter substrate-binding protein [Sanguibacter gelidistatuariae]SDD57604.1 glycine betaine/proline transport system substrate-binding protein [Sanguibacter gelidistatuariae]
MSHALISRGALGVATIVMLGFAVASGTGAASSTSAVGNGDEQTLSIGIHSGWDEGIAVSYLFKAMLEDEGYTVTTTEADPGVVYTGLTGGDFDVNFDMWLPNTHADYLETYGDQMEQLGVWYDQARNAIAVNEDSPITSIDELAANADLFGNRIVGIEAGAGLTAMTKDKAIPGYGLENMDFLISSTPAMLAELKGATDAGENIAVTLWSPHWAYDAFPIRDLEDPKGLMGEAEEIHSVGRTGFAEDYPTLSSWISAFKLDDDQLFSLENLMFNENGGSDNDASARAWLEANPTFVDDLKAASASAS